MNLLQEMARRLVTFGLHVHVGVDSGDKAVMICDRIMRHLPTLLALSVSSPFWEGRSTGLQSHRSKVMEGLPTAGLPTLMRNWSEYVWLVNHMVDTGFINTIREIWWDVRPHHNFGTVEVRVCDMPGNLHDTLALAALMQCLVKALSDEIDHGTYQHDSHPMMVQQNKWRAARFGNQARLVDTYTYRVGDRVADTVERLVELLRPTAAELRCENYLEPLRHDGRQPERGPAAARSAGRDERPAEVVRRLVEEARISSGRRQSLNETSARQASDRLQSRVGSGTSSHTVQCSMATRRRPCRLRNECTAPTVRTCYDLLTVVPACGVTDFTDGKYVDDRNDRAAYLAAQERQAEYLARSGALRAGHAAAGYRLRLRADSGARRAARARSRRHHDLAAASGELSGRGLDVRELNYRNILAIEPSADRLPMRRGESWAVSMRLLPTVAGAFCAGGGRGGGAGG